MEIIHINSIVFNQRKTQFAIAYDKGVIIYDTINFNISSSSENLGNISIVSLVYELNIIIFSAGDGNENYSKNKVVVYDNQNKKELSSFLLKDEVYDIQVINKYIIVETVRDREINIFKFNMDETLFLDKAKLHFMPTFPCVSWVNINNGILNEDSINILAQFSQQEAEIFKLSAIDDKFTTKSKIALPYYPIQRVFYSNISNCIYFVNYHGEKVAEWSINDNSITREFYRGNSYGKIVDLQIIKEKYLLMINSNKTIHIFSLTNKHQISITSYISSFFVTDTLYYSFIKIPIGDISENENNSDIERKGLIAISKEEIVNCIGYNGFIYSFKIDYINHKYTLISKNNFKFKEENSKEEFKVIKYAENI